MSDSLAIVLATCIMALVMLAFYAAMLGLAVLVIVKVLQATGVL